MVSLVFLQWMLLVLMIIMLVLERTSLRRSEKKTTEAKKKTRKTKKRNLLQIIGSTMIIRSACFSIYERARYYRFITIFKRKLRIWFLHSFCLMSTWSKTSLKRPIVITVKWNPRWRMEVRKIYLHEAHYDDGRTQMLPKCTVFSLLIFWWLTWEKILFAIIGRRKN